MDNANYSALIVGVVDCMLYVIFMYYAFQSKQSEKEDIARIQQLLITAEQP